MTTNKPEAVYATATHRSRAAAELMRRTGERAIPLVHLADYQRLQADHERLQAECKRLQAECKRLQAECEALRKDAERIEWLEEQTKKSYTGISFDYHRHVEDGYVVDHGYRFMRRHFVSGFMDSLRKAIDAAMQGDNP